MKEIVAGLVGFTFALLLFYLQETLKEQRTKKTLLEYLKRELQNNSIIIDQWIKDVKKDLYFLTWAHPIYTFTPEFKNFRRLFIEKAIDTGLIYDLLNDTQVSNIMRMLSFFSENNQEFIEAYINEYKDVAVVDEDGTPGKELIRSLLNSELEILQQKKSELNQIMPLLTDTGYKFWHYTHMPKLFCMGRSARRSENNEKA